MSKTNSAQLYRLVCAWPDCEDVVERRADQLFDGEKRAAITFVEWECGHIRAAFASPQEDGACAVQYAKHHPAAAAEAKAVVARLDSGVEPADIELGPRLAAVNDQGIQATVVPVEDERGGK